MLTETEVNKKSDEIIEPHLKIIKENCNSEFLEEFALEEATKHAILHVEKIVVREVRLANKMTEGESVPQSYREDFVEMEQILQNLRERIK